MDDDVYCASFAVICWLICVVCTYVARCVCRSMIFASHAFSLWRIFHLYWIFIYSFFHSPRLLTGVGTHCSTDGECYNPLALGTFDWTVHAQHQKWSKTNPFLFGNRVLLRLARRSTKSDIFAISRCANTISKRANFDENPNCLLDGAFYVAHGAMEYLKKNVCRR